MKKTFLIVCICACLFFHANAENYLPQMHISSPRLNYFINKNGNLSLKWADEQLFAPITLRYRGSSSAFNTGKRNYNIHIKDQEGQKKNASLLHLRFDDDYVLDGMLSDLSRMRNRVAMELWEKMGSLPWTEKSGAVDGAFVELYFNDAYKGIYALNERLDRKQLDLSKINGRIYKTTNAEMQQVNVMDVQNTAYHLPRDSDTEWYNVEAYFKGNGQNAWGALTDFVTFCAETDVNTFEKHIEEYLDLEHCAQYYLFIQCIGATDNMNKNMVIVAQDVEKNGKLYFVPWDLDASFGRMYNAEIAEYTYMDGNGLFDKLLNMEKFQEILKTKYALLRREIMNTPSIMSLFQKHYDLFLNSGALERETARFSTYQHILSKNVHTLNVAQEMQFIEAYLEARFTFLDTLFQ